MLTAEPTSLPAPVGAQPVWRHVPALDGLRGAAVIGVLLFHDGRLKGGFLGVDLFFALSGFLITGLLLDERARTGAVRLSAFWARRARRLLPAMLMFLAVIVPLMALWGTPSQLDDARRGVIPALLYVINWHQIRDSSDYWALFTDPSPMAHLWSLAVEEQFYIVWPLVVALVFTRARWRRWLHAVVIGGIAASLVAMFALYDPASPTRVYIGTDTRASSILFGALLALVGGPRLAANLAKRSRHAMQAVQLALVAGLAAMWIMVDGQRSSWLFHGGLALHGLAAAVLAASIGLPAPTVVQRALSNRVLRWFGTISYGLYLWHWPVFILLDERRTGLDGLALSALRFSVSIGIAVVSLRLVEDPIRRDHRRWTTNRTRLALAGTALVAVVMVFVVPTPDTAPAAFDPTSITSPTTVAPAPTTAPVIVTPTSPSASTTTVAPLPTISKVLWQGDSVAFDAAPGVVAALQAAGLTTEVTAQLGLGLVAREGQDPFPNQRTAVEQFRPDVVVFMLSSWDAPFSSADQLAAFDNYTSMVLDSGARLVILTPPPLDPIINAVPLTALEQRSAELAASDPDRVTYLDASALWGPYARDVNGDGIPDRKADGVHVCAQGAALLGNWLAQQLAQRFSGVRPAPPAEWAGGAWTQEQRYSNPPGTCSA